MNLVPFMLGFRVQAATASAGKYGGNPLGRTGLNFKMLNRRAQKIFAKVRGQMGIQLLKFDLMWI